MSSSYVPLVLRLEVQNSSKIVQSFCDDSTTILASPKAGERTRQRLIPVNRSSPPKKECTKAEAPTTREEMASEPSHNYHKGNRTYSEVVIESLDGDKLIDVPSSSGTSTGKAGSEPPLPDSAPYYSGNPLTEKTEGIMHFYKYNDERLMNAAQCKMLCMLAVSAHIPVSELISFIGLSLPMIERLKVVRDSTPNQYMLIIKFKEHNDAVTFYEEYNNCPFNDIEPHHCTLLFVDRIECTTSDELLSSPSSNLTELPTCAVCLERMDESVLAILCNHSFHAQCLEQWMDNTCPVCRYVQAPEVVEEQRCNDCGQSNDLWICLICGNIGCGRYASQHAHRHWETTSHTYSLKVGGERVWDYAGDNYVHRLIANENDGKLVEYQRDPNARDEKKDDKLDGIKLEYTLLLTGQLENQRKYFEERLADVEQAMAKMEKMACAQVESLEQKLKEQSSELKTVKGELEQCQKVKQSAEKKVLWSTERIRKLADELHDEQEINKMLRKDQVVWKGQYDKIGEKIDTSKAKYEAEIADLQGQVNDLMMHFETQTKLQEQLDAGTVTKEEITESKVGINETSSSKKLHKQKRK